MRERKKEGSFLSLPSLSLFLFLSLSPEDEGKRRNNGTSKNGTRRVGLIEDEF